MGANPETAPQEQLRLLVTIGIPLGLALDPEKHERVAMLRHGRELLNLDVDAYQILLRGGPGASRDKLAEWGRGRNVPEVGSVIDRCVDAGLLREVDFSTRGASEQWRKLRIHPVGVGMGVDADDRCRIDVPRRESANVERFAYSVWAASDGRSIQDVVDSLLVSVGANRFALSAVWPNSTQDNMATFAEAAVGDPAVAPVLTAHALPGAVFDLVNQGAAYLDVVP